MPLLSSSDSSPRNSLRLPAQIRISIPASQRLTTITEGPQALDPPPPIPRRSSRRNSASHSEANSRRQSRRWSGSATSDRTAPPPYEWKPEPLVVDDSDAVPDERLEKLRRERKNGDDRSWRRGGWARALMIAVVVVVILAIALGVGLGIGLKERRSHNGEADQDQDHTPPGSGTPPQKFPLGQYSFDTALRTVSTDCTSNPATWRCFPYYVYNPDGSTNDTSLATFNWIISNTSATYATSDTPSTPKEGVAANMTVSTTDNPFSIMFTNKPLTYISDSTNSTSARYTFDFVMPRRIVPSPAITGDNTNAECFFNQTVYSANIYLTAGRSIYLGGATDKSSPGGYEPWPYAVEIKQAASGGKNVPDCYQSIDGQLGDPVTAGLVQQPSNAECICDYRNY